MESVDKLLGLIRRELGTDEVELVTDPPEGAPNLLVRAAGNKGYVVARFAEPVSPDDVRARRLEMLIDSFPDLAMRPTVRPQPRVTLLGELATLVARVGAVDAVVIDAQSPVVWGAAVSQREGVDPTNTDPAGLIDGDDLDLGPIDSSSTPVGAWTKVAPLSTPPRSNVTDNVVQLDEVRSSAPASSSPSRRDRSSGADVVALNTARPPSDGPRPVSELPPRSSSEGPVRTSSESPIRTSTEPTGASALSSEPPPPPTTRRAIDAVRALPEVSQLHRGGHLHHMQRDEEFGYIARSFASIYVLILVFERPFDEVRAERGLTLSLPIIERLVLALPPVDPPPHAAGAAALPRRRRS